MAPLFSSHTLQHCSDATGPFFFLLKFLPVNQDVRPWAKGTEAPALLYPTTVTASPGAASTAATAGGRAAATTGQGRLGPGGAR